MVFRGTEGISEIEFWQDGKWPKDDIVWPEDVYGTVIEEDLDEQAEEAHEAEEATEAQKAIEA